MPGAGQLNTLITIQKPSKSAQSGTGEVILSFNDYHRKIPSQMEHVSGGSTRRGDQVEEGVSVVFTIPFIKDLSPEWRVKVLDGTTNPRVLEIKAILEDQYTSTRWAVLHCGDVR